MSDPVIQHGSGLWDQFKESTVVAGAGLALASMVRLISVKQIHQRIDKLEVKMANTANQTAIGNAYLKAMAKQMGLPEIPVIEIQKEEGNG